MKTLLITLDYPPQHGGVANYYANLVKNWPIDEIDVLDNNKRKLNNPKIPLLEWLPAFFSIFYKVLTGRYCHIIVGQILPIGTVVWLVAKVLNKKYTVVLHGMDLSLAFAHPRKKKIALKILDNSENIICNSSYTAHQLQEKYEKYKNKIAVVHPGINPGERTRFHEKEDELKNKHSLDTKNVIFSLGRLVERKGFDMLIQAMPEVLEHVPNAHYYIAGEGPDKKRLEDIINELDEKSKQHVHMLGKASDEEKWAWLYHSKLFAMPARDIDGDYEGFGIVYLEANLANKAVVAGRSGGIEDAVIDYETGILCDPDNPCDIAGAIIDLIKKNKLRKELSSYGRERAIEEFNWEKQARIFWSIISK